MPHKCDQEECKHEKVKYCDKCEKAYCEDCDMEWLREPEVKTWIYPQSPQWDYTFRGNPSCATISCDGL